jgi:hypothetical protein
MKRKNSILVNLDERVTVTLIASCVISIAIMLWSIRASDDDHPSPGKISFSYGTHYAGDTIHFTVKSITDSNTHAVWHFGDNLKQKRKGNSADHAYTKPGKYIVKITIDDIYSSETTIYIMPPDVPQFIVPETVFVGDQVISKDTTPNATSWEWRFGETGSVDATVRNPKYVFTKAGSKKVILVVNGTMQGERIVYVQNKPTPIVTGPTIPKEKVKKVTETEGPEGGPLPPPGDPTPPPEPQPPPPPPLPSPISETELQHMLYQVVAGQSNASNFTDYLSNLNIEISYNGAMITFPELCVTLRNIKSKKKIKKLVVTRTIDPLTNLVKNMTVILDKKWINKVTGLL